MKKNAIIIILAVLLGVHSIISGILIIYLIQQKKHTRDHLEIAKKELEHAREQIKVMEEYIEITKHRSEKDNK